MAELRRGVALLLGVALLVGIAATPALAVTTVESTGKTGTFAVADSTSEAAMRCTYTGEALATVGSAGPKVFGRTKRLRKVGLSMEVLRYEWWQWYPDIWSTAYSTGIVKKRAKISVPAAYPALEWAVPEDMRSPYDVYRVRLTMYWYAPDGLTEVGHTIAELDYHGFQQQGQPFDPANVAGPSAGCAGSTQQPTVPDAPRAEPPLGFSRMSHWVTFWTGWSEEHVLAVIDDLKRMNQTGVILQGMRWGNSYYLPADVSHYLTLFLRAGIQPYLALFVGSFGDAEAATALRAWNAGDGQWAGIVLDVEAGFVRRVEADPEAALHSVDVFMARVRPLTSLLAYTSWSTPVAFPDLMYDTFNSYCDIFMPQAYFRLGFKDPIELLDQIDQNLALVESDWARSAIPMVPIVNDWGPNAAPGLVTDYVTLALQRYGAISGFRVHPQMRADIKDMWAGFAP